MNREDWVVGITETSITRDLERMSMSYDRNGESGAFQLVAGIITSGIIAAFTFPLVFEQLEAVDLGQYSDGVAALWNLFPQFMVLILFLGFVGLALQAQHG